MVDPKSSVATSPRRGWSPEEHERYLDALVRFPNGPWRALAEDIGTRSTRQVMTHASKIALKAQRHARGLKAAGRRPRGNSNDVSSAVTETAKTRRQRKAQRKTQRSAAEALVASASAEPQAVVERPVVGTKVQTTLLSASDEPRLPEPVHSSQHSLVSAMNGVVVGENAVFDGMDWGDWIGTECIV